MMLLMLIISNIENVCLIVGRKEAAGVADVDADNTAICYCCAKGGEEGE